MLKHIKFTFGVYWSKFVSNHFPKVDPRVAMGNQINFHRCKRISEQQLYFKNGHVYSQHKRSF